MTMTDDGAARRWAKLRAELGDAEFNRRIAQAAKEIDPNWPKAKKPVLEPWQIEQFKRKIRKRKKSPIVMIPESRKED